MFKGRKMISFDDSKGFSSTVDIDYRVKGLWSRAHKKFATKTMQKNTSNEDFYFVETFSQYWL